MTEQLKKCAQKYVSVYVVCVVYVVAVSVDMFKYALQLLLPFSFKTKYIHMFTGPKHSTGIEKQNISQVNVHLKHVLYNRAMYK